MTSVEELREQVAGIDWWHTIDLGHGIVTPGRGGSQRLLARMRMPDDLTGQTVLDIGTFDGCFAFEAERRGASRVLAIDHRTPPGFQLAHRALGSRVEFRQLSVLDLSPALVGRFDLVLFLGVLYHLPNPMEALQRVCAVTRRQMILESDGALDGLRTPAAKFIGSRAAMQNSALNWWLPNMPCLLEMVKAAGFGRAEPVFGPLPPRLPWKVARRLFPKRFAPKSSRLVVHAWN